MCREDSPWSSPRWRHVGLRLTRSTRCVLARGRHRQGAGVARGVRVTPPFAAVAAAPPPRALAAVRRLRGGPAAVGGRGDVEVGQGAVGGAGRDVGVVRRRRGPAARLFPRPPARGVLTVVPVLVEAPGAPARKQNFRGAFTRHTGCCTMWRNLRAPDVLGSRTSTPAAAAGDSSYAGDGGKASRSRLYIAILTVIRSGPSSSPMTPPLPPSS